MCDGQAMERAKLLAARLHLVGLGGVGSGHLGDQCNDGVDLRIDAVDLFEALGEGFAGGELLRANQLGHLDRRGEAERRRGRLGFDVGGKSGGQKCCGGHPQQDFAAGRLVGVRAVVHGCDFIILAGETAIKRGQIYLEDIERARVAGGPGFEGLDGGTD